MVEALLLVIALGVVFGIVLTIVCLHQIHKLKEVYSMTTADLLVALNESNALTTEIASDIDKLVAAVEASDEVPAEVADVVNSLKSKLTEAAAKYTAPPEGGGETSPGS